jgi:hypothetical protein
MIDKDIPGMMNHVELFILKRLASMVPQNGKILEIGAFCGRTTSALYKSKDPSVKLTVVDLWNIPPPYRLINDRICCGDSQDFIVFAGSRELLSEAFEISNKQGTLRAGFEYCLSDIIHDIEVIQMDSSEFTEHETYDLIFIDAGHDFEGVNYDIVNSIVNNKTLVVGDDHTVENFVPVVQAVQHNKTTRCVILPLGDVKLWVLIPTVGYWRENLNTIFSIMESKDL